ncbi:MAG: hypothetical protein IDH49_01115 [Gammaproteobacteria bacterium]|nr:hypothetical protein [Gammaproteobacteria bacterium]
MDWYKFESLLNTRSLYLCRADRLEDRFEGTYSRRQLVDMEQWIEKVTDSDEVLNEREARARDRLRTYINCWCVGDTDFDLMWKGYVRKSPGVAVKSTVAALERACDEAIEKWPLDISLVNYFDHAGGQWIDYFGTPSIFFWKDLHFSLENEIRIVHWPNIADSPPENVWLPVQLDVLIEAVVMSPKATEECAAAAKQLLERSGLKQVPVLYSRDDRNVYV